MIKQNNKISYFRNISLVNSAIKNSLFMYVQTYFIIYNTEKEFILFNISIENTNFN